MGDPRARRESVEAPLPVTLVSGFLGSGKTSLLRHIMQNREGMRIAVIVNEITSLNLDAVSLNVDVVCVEGGLVELSNGCICCTLRPDLWRQLRDLARSASPLWDAVVVESSGLAEPMEVAETFFLEVFEEDGSPSVVLQNVAPLDNCITVVDGTRIDEFIRCDAPIAEHDASALAADERPIGQLLIEQIEFANVVLVNKCDLLTPPKTKMVLEMVRRMNPNAAILPSTHSVRPLAEILRTGNFGEKFARSMGGWMVEEDEGIKHVSETERYDVSSFLFCHDVPFHPQRLHDWLTTHWILSEVVAIPQTEEKNDDASTGGVDWAEVEKKRRSVREQKYGIVLRSKGFVWIASQDRHQLYCTWSQAAGNLTLSPGGRWNELPPHSKLGAAPRQVLSFVGQHMNTEVLQAALSELLLTSSELVEYKRSSKGRRPLSFADPFVQLSYPKRRKRARQRANLNS